MAMAANLSYSGKWPEEPTNSVDHDNNQLCSSSTSHSQAEKRRRDRINGQLAILRKMLPSSEKMDKAALLGSVINHVKDLNKRAKEVEESFTIPSDVDEVTVEREKNLIGDAESGRSKENFFVRASFSCDDRPELLMELVEALKSLGLRTVRADMAALQGRIRSILILGAKNEDDDEVREERHGVCLSTLQQTLGVVLRRIVSAPAPSNYRISSKRQRFFSRSD